MVSGVPDSMHEPSPCCKSKTRSCCREPLPTEGGVPAACSPQLGGQGARRWCGVCGGVELVGPCCKGALAPAHMRTRTHALMRTCAHALMRSCAHAGHQDQHHRHSRARRLWGGGGARAQHGGWVLQLYCHGTTSVLLICGTATAVLICVTATVVLICGTAVMMPRHCTAGRLLAGPARGFGSAAGQPEQLGRTPWPRVWCCVEKRCL